MAYRATAPGKLMLLGEHAVVYGQPCLVTAVGLRYSVTLAPRADDTVEIVTPQLAAARTVALADAGAGPPKETAFVEAVIGRFREMGALPYGFTLTTAGPEISYGLGSSSAVTAATAAALNAWAGTGLDEAGLFEVCYGAVLDVQGRGSGYDVASAIWGGTLYYRHPGPGSAPEIEKLPGEALPLVVAYSGKKVGTVGLVAGVRDLRDRYPALVNPIFQLAGDLTERGRAALAARDYETFAALVNIGGGLTDALGVNTRRLAALTYAAREAGALGAKLSGAGGGDCTFAVVREETREAVERVLVAAGGEIVRLPLNVAGVTIT